AVSRSPSPPRTHARAPALDLTEPTFWAVVTLLPQVSPHARARPHDPLTPPCAETPPSRRDVVFPDARGSVGLCAWCCGGCACGPRYRAASAPCWGLSPLLGWAPGVGASGCSRLPGACCECRGVGPVGASFAAGVRPAGAGGLTGRCPYAFAQRFFRRDYSGLGNFCWGFVTVVCGCG